MKLYTRKGDEGESSLLFGGRISKADPRCDAYGSIDEAVSAMGLGRSLCNNQEIKNILLTIQREMFIVGSELATGPSEYNKLKQNFSVVTTDMVTALENLIDEISSQVELPPEFIVPGASPGSSAIDIARTLVRKAERRVVALNSQQKIQNPEILRYLNRLSDLLFILARFEDKNLPTEFANNAI